MFATLAESDVFHDALNQHARSKLGINFSKLELAKVELPSVIFRSDGKVNLQTRVLTVNWFSTSATCSLQIRFEDATVVKSILRYLTDLCQLSLDSTAPRLEEFGGGQSDEIAM